VLSLSGTGIGRGIAIGRAMVLDHSHRQIPEFTLSEDGVEDEVRRFRNAVARARNGLLQILDSIPADSPPETRAFVDVHLQMLDDPVISEQPAESIRRERKNAEWSLRIHAATLIAFFDGIEDPYLRSKKNDVHQVVDRVVAELMGYTITHLNRLDGDLDGYVIVTHDITPADAVALHQRGMTAFLTSLGGPISHTSILARSLHIPAVVGLHDEVRYIRNDDLLIVDAANSCITVAPDEPAVAEFRDLQRTREREISKLTLLQHRQAVTRDGIEVALLANIELPEDLDSLAKASAEGVGLYRTEFLFMNRPRPPEEDEQFETYCQVLDTVSGPVTIRTLDLGADKQVDGGRTDSERTINPALGLRAIRLCLNEPALFKPQLRAIFRAATRGNARIMIPMLSSLSELEQALELVRETHRELAKEGIEFNPDVPIGGMIEVPAAAVAADLFARKLQFLSIGTNDLIQYTLAIDRIDDEVNYLYDPLHPSVLRLIYRVIEAGRSTGIPVSMCGEMAGDPELTRLLLGLGLREFSMETSSLLQIKQQILNTTVSDIEKAAKDTLQCLEQDRLRNMVEQLNIDRAPVP